MDVLRRIERDTGHMRHGSFPMSSANWYLAAAKERRLSYERDGASGGNNIAWHCAVCGEEYMPGTMNEKRMLIFGAHRNSTEIFATYIGNPAKEQDAAINYLKACSLSAKLGTDVANHQTILKAVNKLNAEC